MPREIRHTIFALALLVAIPASAVSVAAEQRDSRASKRRTHLPPVPLPLLPADQIWIATLDAPPSASGAMDAERVYVPVVPERLQALSRATGATVWRRDIESKWTPVVRAGVVYVAASDEIHALAASTGTEIWRAPFDHPMIAPLVSAGSLLIAVFEPAEVVAFAVTDGHVIWRHALGSPSHLTAVANDKRVFLPLEDSRLVALDLADGAPAWERQLEGLLSQPSVAQNRVFVGSDRNRLYALDEARGRLAWTWKTGGDVLGTGADTKGGAYYASLDNVLRAVNRANGNQRWITQTPSRPALPPDVLGDGVGYEPIVLVTGATSQLDAFATTSGKAAGTYVPPSDIQNPPLVDAALKPYAVAMVVITRDGRAVGLRPSAMALAEPPATPLAELPGRRLERERLAPLVR